ncbi:MAG TPA: hypothetical protein VHV57_19790 [Acidimicrobiales bacterium]|jgi:hypothetical protein|nr:hypothetical protein [Acidimicrobiales bacterium]
MNMIGGLFSSIVVFAVGAILDFAVTVSPYQHGFNVRTVGLILMIVGAVGAFLALVSFMFGSGWRRHRTVVDDGEGHVIRREDTYV